MSTVNREQFEANAAKAVKAGFDKWIENPMARALMSTIPGTEHPETLRALLQAAFEAGFNVGQGSILGEMVESMMRPRR